MSNTTTNESYSEPYPKSAIIVSGISCSLSIIGAIVIFVSYYCATPNVRNFTRRLILCLTVADTLTASGYLIAVARYAFKYSSNSATGSLHTMCEVQSYITTFSSLVSFFLTVCIGLHLSNSVVYKERQTETAMMFLLYNGISWIVPVIIVSVAIGNNVLGEDLNTQAATGPWCWIKNDNNQHVYFWMFFTGKGWEIACYLTTVSIYFLMKFYMYLKHRRERFSTIRTTLRDEDQNFLYIWLILVFLRIWGTLRFFLFIFKQDDNSHMYMKVFLNMQAFGDPAQAFCNSILFCIIDATVRKQLLTYLSCSNVHVVPIPYENESLVGNQNKTSGSDKRLYGACSSQSLSEQPSQDPRTSSYPGILYEQSQDTHNDDSSYTFVTTTTTNETNLQHKEEAGSLPAYNKGLGHSMHSDSGPHTENQRSLASRGFNASVQSETLSNND